MIVSYKSNPKIRNPKFFQEILITVKGKEDSVPVKLSEKFSDSPPQEINLAKSTNFFWYSKGVQNDLDNQDYHYSGFSSS